MFEFVVDEALLHHERALADAEFYKMQKAAEANAVRQLLYQVLTYFI